MADSTAYLPIHTRFMIGGKTELLPKNSRQPFEIMVGYDGYIGKSYVAGSIGAGIKATPHRKRKRSDPKRGIIIV